MGDGVTSSVVSEAIEGAAADLRQALGEDYVLSDYYHRAIRTASAAPFGVHQWQDLLPDLVVRPGSTADVAAIVTIANKWRVPIVPRGAGAGLADGAMPLKRGIIVDIKRMHEVLEIDEDNMTATVQPGINMMELNKILRPLNIFFPDDPASYPVNVLGGRVGTGGWSLIGAGYGHIPDNVISLEVVLPTGKVIRVGEAGNPKIRKASTGYRLKDLFIGHQGTLGIVTELTLDLSPRPEVELPVFFAMRSWPDAHRLTQALGKSGLKTLCGVFQFDEYKVNFLRRDDEAWIPLPDWVQAATGVILYGTSAEVEAAKEVVFAIGAANGGTYLGQEMSEGDWASRHDRYHLAYHGRSGGQIKLLAWSIDDCAVPWASLPAVKKRWYELAEALVAKHPEHFDLWGMFMYTNNPFRPWGDHLAELDMGVNELEMTTEIWADWIEFKTEVARVAVQHGGSVSACHGGTREGEVNVSVYEELANGTYDLMKQVKALLDPNNIMNPGKYNLDEAYGEEEA